jgi:OOP family OmpA-OmpF porin
VPAMLLGACSTSRVPEMNTVSMGGDSFDRNLARNYKDFSNYEAYEMYDWSDAVVYADKSMAAADGKPVTPDDLSGRNIKGADKVAELRTGRTRLMQALGDGAAKKTPVNAARAQADFDCWAEQQEEGWQVDHIAACKDGFWRALLATETAMAPPPAQLIVTERAIANPAASEAAQPRPYLVFFDWDKSGLTPEAQSMLDQVVQRIRATGHDVRLIGHADASGSDAYNMVLSQERAEGVKNHLIANGIAPNTIDTKWVGESEPIVATADGVREPKNRWVAIDVRTATVSSR